MKEYEYIAIHVIIGYYLVQKSYCNELATYDIKTFENIVYQVNSQNSTWKASMESVSPEFVKNLKHMTGTLIPKNQKPKEYRHRDLETYKSGSTKLPENFDSRSHWEECPSIKHIYDQGSCGSCWAVSAAASFADRTCIASKGERNSKRSAHQLISCCQKCTPLEDDDGCQGGYVDEAWEYFKKVGLVTGGDYQSEEGCQPYLYQKCDHLGLNNSSLPACSSIPEETAGRCKFKCHNKKYKKKFRKDLIKAKSSYDIGGMKEAMMEIYNDGPITAIFEVYTDFFMYRSGVYQHMYGLFAGYHAVRIIGWGEDNGMLYWLVTNSWNDSWGDEGLFKILRGRNHLLIEGYMNAGIPNV